MSEPIRILIVEDIPTDYELAIREIRKSLANCAFKRVETEPDYLDALERFKPDLILADYHLPCFSGMEALKLALERAPLTALIIFSGSLSEDIAVDCMKAGAANYVIKQNIKRLGVAVVHALEEKRIRIERNRAEEELRYLSIHDALTGSFNRGFFLGEIERPERGRGYPISILMADVDRLKETNDLHGHAAADDLLKRTAQALIAVFRAEEVIARIGGDEFAVLLPATGHMTAEVLLRRVEQAILEHNNAQTGTPICLSLGLGTAERAGPLLNVLKEADANMYRQKQGTYDAG